MKVGDKVKHHSCWNEVCIFLNKEGNIIYKENLLVKNEYQVDFEGQYGTFQESELICVVTD
jgi:hypothetical protein